MADDADYSDLPVPTGGADYSDLPIPSLTETQAAAPGGAVAYDPATGTYKPDPNVQPGGYTLPEQAHAADETALQFVTGAGAQLGGGLGYLQGLLMGDPATAKRAYEKISEKGTYQPQSRAGQEASENAGKAMQGVVDFEGNAGEALGGLVGPKTAAAYSELAKGSTQAAPWIMGLGDTPHLDAAVHDAAANVKAVAQKATSGAKDAFKVGDVTNDNARAANGEPPENAASAPESQTREAGWTADELFNAPLEDHEHLQVTEPTNAGAPAKHPIDIVSHADTGEHVIKSPNGASLVQEDPRSGYLRVIRSDTTPAAQGKGEGAARTEAAADLATKLKQPDGSPYIAASDKSITPQEAATWNKMAANTDKAVIMNPHTVVQHEGGGITLRTNNAGAPVIEVAPGPRPDLGADTGTPFSTISAAKADLSPAENAQRTFELHQELKKAGLEATPAEGGYKYDNGETATPEQSFIVQAPDDAARAKIEELGKKFDQESVLHVDGDRTATFQYMDGRPTKPFGKWAKVAPEDVGALSGWTKDAKGGTYTLKPAEAAEGAVEPPTEPPAGPAGPAPKLGDRIPGQRGAVGDFKLPQRERGGSRSEADAGRALAGGIKPKANDYFSYQRDNAPKLGDLKPGQRGAVGDLNFRHFSNADKDELELNPKFYGTGLKGEEAKRVAGGAPKSISLYGEKHPNSQIEPGLRNKPEYRVSVPSSKMYDLSADPKGFLDKSKGDFTRTEQLIKSAGYHGYHLPEGDGIFKGQGRIFKPTKAVRVGGESAPSNNVKSRTGHSGQNSDTGDVRELSYDRGSAIKSGQTEAEIKAAAAAEPKGVKGNMSSREALLRHHGLTEAADRYALANAPKLGDLKKSQRGAIGVSQALETNVPVEMPKHPEFEKAVANTPSAELTTDGLKIRLQRNQKPEQEGAQAIRTGVFYLPEGAKNARHYKDSTNTNAYGGADKHTGETLIRKPLFVKGATGGKMPEQAYDTIKGKGAAEKLRGDAFRVTTDPNKFRDPELFKEVVQNFLREHGGEPGLANEIIANSKRGNNLRYALTEHVIAHAVRDAGYDAAVGYSKGKNGPFISEIFDTREQNYPARGVESQVHDKYMAQAQEEHLAPHIVNAQKREPEAAPKVAADRYAMARASNKQRGSVGFWDDRAPKVPAGKERTPAEQTKVEETLRNVLGAGAEVRQSAITGDHDATGMDHEDAKLTTTPIGQRMSNVIQGEREGMAEAAKKLVHASGGTPGTDTGALRARGQTLEAPIRGFHEALDTSMTGHYKQADIDAQGKPIEMNGTKALLKGARSSFLSTVEGKQLLEGFTARGKELGLFGDSEDFKPATVKQAESLRQYLKDAWTPRTNKLIAQLTNAIDDDVTKAAGKDIYGTPRQLRALRAAHLEEPEGTAALLHTKEQNRLGINRQVDLEDIPGHVENLSVDQFDHLIKTYKRAANGNMDLAKQSAAALNEVRAQFANRIADMGAKTKGMWDQTSVQKYFETNAAKMEKVFSPKEMQQYRDLVNAGSYLEMDRVYKGAEAQKQNFAIRGMTSLAKHGSVKGAVVGHIPGAVIGYGAEKLGAAAEKMHAKGVEKRIKKL